MYSEKQILKVVEDQSAEKGIKILKNILDNDSHPAFLELNIIDEITNTLTKTGKYFKCVRNFNELQCILNVRLENNTDATITIASDTRIASINLPKWLQEKIYAHTGYKLSELSANTSIATNMLYLTNTSGSLNSQNPKYINLYGTTEGLLTFFLEGGTIEVQANGKIDLEFRISLWL